MFLNDSETETDLLYYEAIATTLVRFIKETPVAPVTIGVHGDWGAGKSSVLKMAEAQLKGNNKMLCLWFNGWQFEGFEDARTVLIETLLQELGEKRTLSEKGKKLVAKLLKRVDWLKAARKAGGLTLTAFTGIPSLDQLGGVVDLVTKFLKKPEDQFSVEEIKAFAEEAKGYLKEPKDEVERIPKHVHAFRKEFEELLKETNVDRLVVIVDDLDRCLPKTAIATLEAIRLFLMVDRTAFVIGADELMIEYAVKEHFPDLPPSSGPVGYARNYLEKLIQVPLRVPALGLAETRVYITLLLAELALPKGDETFAKLMAAAREDMKRPWESRGIDAILLKKSIGDSVPTEVREAQAISSVLSTMLTEGTHGNPRQIKRFLNSMMLRRAIAEERGFGNEISLPVLGKLMLAERFYPDFYKKLAELANVERGRPVALAQLENASMPSGKQPKPGTASQTTDKRDAAKSDEPTPISPEVGEWLKFEWIKGWAAMDPKLCAVDLRPYVFVTRDKRGVLGAAASSHLEEIVERLLGKKMAARSCVSELSKFSPQELDEVFAAVSDHVAQADNLSLEPPGVQGLWVLSEHSPVLGQRLLDFAKSLNVAKVGVWVTAMVGNVKVKHPALSEPVIAQLTEWANSAGGTLKKAAENTIGMLNKRA